MSLCGLGYTGKLLSMDSDDIIHIDFTELEY